MTPTINDDPAIINIRIKQGATFRHTLIWETGADEASAIPTDLTGATASLIIRDDRLSATVLLTLDTSNGGLTLGGTAGTIELFLNATQTAAISFTRGAYELEVAFSNGDVCAFMAGSVMVLNEVVK